MLESNLLANINSYMESVRYLIEFFTEDQKIKPNFYALDNKTFESLKTSQKKELSDTFDVLAITQNTGRVFSYISYVDKVNFWSFPFKRDLYNNKEKYSIPYTRPLKDYEPSSFGAIRKYGIHTGVDLYTEEFEKIYPVESGIVTNIEIFTGEEVGSPWWNTTKAVWVKGKSGIVVYGEIEPIVSIGDRVTTDTKIGHVLRVLKKDKGRPMDMLHLELYQEGMTETVIWDKKSPKPKFLEDPTPHLILNQSIASEIKLC